MAIGGQGAESEVSGPNTDRNPNGKPGRMFFDDYHHIPKDPIDTEFGNVNRACCDSNRLTLDSEARGELNIVNELVTYAEWPIMFTAAPRYTRTYQ